MSGAFRRPEGANTNAEEEQGEMVRLLSRMFGRTDMCPLGIKC